MFNEPPPLGWATERMKSDNIEILCKVSDFKKIKKLSNNLLCLYKRINSSANDGEGILGIDMLAHDFGCSEKLIEERLNSLSCLGLIHGYGSAKKSPSFVYFIQEGSEGLIKIGKSSSPKDRIRNLKTGNTSGFKFNFLGMIDGDISTESRIHKKFSDIRVTGEWFSPTNELTSFIRKVVSKAVCNNV